MMNTMRTLHANEYQRLSSRSRTISHDFEQSKTLLVYGSMRQEGRNHHRLKDTQCEHLGGGFVSGIQLWVNPLTEICYVTPGDSKVYVEAYRLSHVNVLTFIDQCEGHPWAYTRKLLSSKFWTYMLLNFNYKSKLTPLLQKVDHGDYIQWRIDHMRSQILNH
jgi:gamma-glutamylcyclotransferase (GGCT)/AIG2-like uncharacterized protein YtfP